MKQNTTSVRANLIKLGLVKPSPIQAVDYKSRSTSCRQAIAARRHELQKI